MKKKVLLLLSFFLCYNQWGEGYNRYVPRLEEYLEKAPIGSVGWYIEGKDYNVMVADTYREHDAYAYIESDPDFAIWHGGLGSTRYWLYDTYTSHNGEISVFFDKYLPEWLRRGGYFIDGPITQDSTPQLLDDSIKKLMIRESCDLAITLLPWGSHADQNVFIIVINFDKKNNNFILYSGCGKMF